MCVIVIQKPNVKFETDLAKKLWTINDDGGGYAFIHPDTKAIHTFKSLEWEEFWGAYQADVHEFGSHTTFVAHMRIATHGAVCLDNCHPFEVNEHTVLFHNGVIPIAQDKEDTRSDSKAFAEDLVSTLPNTWLDNEWIRLMMEEWVGWSRILFMTTDPECSESIYVLNKKEWVTYHDLEFSNSTGLWATSATVTKSGKWVSAYARPFGRYSCDADGDWSEDDKRAWEWDDDALVLSPRNKHKPISYEARKAELVHLRQSINLTKPVAFVIKDDVFECYGCDGIIDEETGLCDCWDMWCEDCQHIAGECRCKNGWSVHLVPLAPVPEEPEEVRAAQIGGKLVLFKEKGKDGTKKATKGAAYTQEKDQLTDEKQSTGPTS